VLEHPAWLAQEPRRLIAFARGSAVPGGFAWLDAVGAPDPSRPLALWITTRMTHVFAVGHLTGEPDCAGLVDHGLAALGGTFADREHGGWFGELRDGRPDGTAKEAYGHAFVLLAACSAKAAGRPGAERLLAQAAEVIERRFWSDAEGACRESWDRDWAAAEDYRGANANMHLVEAFLAAGDVTGADVWHTRALRIAERLIDGEARAHEWRLPEHYDGRWRPLPRYNADAPRHPFRPYGATPGHALEWARLLVQLHETLPAPPGWLAQAARRLFARAVADGWDPVRGGFAYTTDLAGRPVVRDRFHWVVAEAMAAAAALHAFTREAGYADWYDRFCGFADTHLRDLAHGSWRHELDPENRPAAATWPGKPDVYHALQASLLPRLAPAPSLAVALARSR
jgi:mannose/cellobiose epimerase-like protein (N-acyl-D-glucosamine 2-epimerase family)